MANKGAWSSCSLLVLLAVSVSLLIVSFKYRNVSILTEPVLYASYDDCDNDCVNALIEENGESKGVIENNVVGDSANKLHPNPFSKSFDSYMKGTKPSRAKGGRGSPDRVITQLDKLLPYGNVPDDPSVKYDVTFCSQGTLTRWVFMKEIARRWSGPMSIVYYFPPENLTYFENLRATTDLRPNMKVNYVLQTDPEYFPINALRNLAIENAETTHFWLADMDVWPSKGTYEAIRNLPRDFFADPKNIGIVPVFQNRKLKKCSTFEECAEFYSTHLPETKAELNACKRRGVCQTFRPGENLHNYYFTAWYYENYTAPLSKLVCFKTDTQEPYIVVRKTPDMPRFDVRFANYAYNKVQWIENLRYRGYAFWVITHAYGFDIPHPPSAYRKAFFKEMKRTHRFPMKLVYDQFLKELRANYTDEAVTPFCRGVKRNRLVVNV